MAGTGSKKFSSIVVLSYDLDMAHFFFDVFLGPRAASRRLASLASSSARFSFSWVSLSSFSACLYC
jgi:hypothetical protein